jgi:hypothetical protein
VKKSASIFSIGDALQPNRFLLFNRFSNAAVFYRTQFFFGYLIVLGTLASLEQLLRPEQTADVISPKGWI